MVVYSHTIWRHKTAIEMSSRGGIVGVTEVGGGDVSVYANSVGV